MFTQKEAEAFVHLILVEIFTSGKDQLLRQYYAQNFVGHYQDNLYYFEDVVKRVQAFKQEAEAFEVKIKSVMLFGTFINIISELKWINKTNHQSYQVTRHTNWLIKDKQIEEAWVMWDKETPTFQEMNQEFTSNTQSFKILNSEEAKHFLIKLNNDIFVNARLQSLNQYYHSEFIGHFNDQVFNLDDIKNRVEVIKQYAKNYEILIQNTSVSGNMITATLKISFFNKLNNSFYEAKQFNSYLIEDMKVKEVWIILDREAASYKEMSTINADNYENLLLTFEIKNKYKQEYLDKLKAIFNTTEYSIYKISNSETECIYYYLNGFSAKETAQIMKLSPRTVESYLSIIKQKLNCNTRFQLRKKIFP